MSAARHRPSANDERRAKAAALKAAQERSDRRRARLIALVVGLVVLALVVPTTVLVVQAQRESTRVAVAANEPIEGEEVVDVPSATHVIADVPYEGEQQEETAGLLPPLGGDHDPLVQNCGFYDAPVRSENAVHSLEHGAVWLTYRTGLEEAQVAALRDLAGQNPYLLVSPFDQLASDVVATAWGVQLELDSARDDRLGPFLARYLQGKQTPEPGAACSGGTGEPAV